MMWNLLLVAILVIPFVVINDGDHAEEDDTEPGHLLVEKNEDENEKNKMSEMIGPTKRQFIDKRYSHLLCGLRSPMLEAGYPIIKRFSDYEEEDYVVNRTIMDRMQGGRNQIYGEVPWHVNLVYESPHNIGQFYRFCNGAIYNNLWVVTTARCASNFSHYVLGSGLRTVPNIWVFIGDHTANQKDRGEERFRIIKFIINPSFDPKLPDDDIAILKVDGMFNLNEYIQPICMIERGEYIVDVKSVLVSSMGRTHQGSIAPSDHLRIMTAKTRTCDFPPFKRLGLLCLSNTGGATICSGDNGAPVATKIGKNWILLGLIGFINPNGCAPTESPPYIIDMNFLYYWVYWHIIEDMGIEAEIPRRS